MQRAIGKDERNPHRIVRNRKVVCAANSAHIWLMVKHKFGLGDRVRLLVGALDGDIPDGAYKISRILPVEGITCRYRVQHERDNHERVVREEQVAPFA